MAMGGRGEILQASIIRWVDGYAVSLLPAELEARVLVALMVSSDRVSGAKRP